MTVLSRISSNLTDWPVGRNLAIGRSALLLRSLTECLVTQTESWDASLEASNCSDGIAICCLLWNMKFHYRHYKIHRTILWTIWIQFKYVHPIFLKPFLLLSSRIRLGSPQCPRALTIAVGITSAKTDRKRTLFASFLYLKRIFNCIICIMPNGRATTNGELGYGRNKLRTLLN